jgi:hypothetical protein
MNNIEYVVAGYLLTAGALGGYFTSLVFRARRARGRVEAVAQRRRPSVS